MSLGFCFLNILLCCIYSFALYSFVSVQNKHSKMKKIRYRFSKWAVYTGYYLICINLKINKFSKILFILLYFFVIIKIITIPFDFILYILYKFKIASELFLSEWIKISSKFSLWIFRLFGLLFLINYKLWRK